MKIDLDVSAWADGANVASAPFIASIFQIKVQVDNSWTKVYRPGVHRKAGRALGAPMQLMQIIGTQENDVAKSLVTTVLSLQMRRVAVAFKDGVDIDIPDIGQVHISSLQVGVPIPGLVSMRTCKPAILRPLPRGVCLLRHNFRG